MRISTNPLGSSLAALVALLGIGCSSDDEGGGGGGQFCIPFRKVAQLVVEPELYNLNSTQLLQLNVGFNALNLRQAKNGWILKFILQLQLC